MKKIIGMVLVMGMVSCNNPSENSSTSNDTAQSEIGGVENVNGNMPDTSNTGATPKSGDNTPAVDSTYADSMHKVK